MWLLSSTAKKAMNGCRLYKKERDYMAVRGTTPDYTLTLVGYDIKGVE